MFDIWIVNKDAHPVERVGAEDDPNVALMVAAQILKKCGSPALDARNLETPDFVWPFEPSLIVYDPTTTIPVRVVVVGSTLTERDGSLARTPVGAVPLTRTISE